MGQGHLQGEEPQGRKITSGGAGTFFFFLFWEHSYSCDQDQ